MMTISCKDKMILILSLKNRNKLQITKMANLSLRNRGTFTFLLASCSHLIKKKNKSHDPEKAAFQSAPNLSQPLANQKITITNTSKPLQKTRIYKNIYQLIQFSTNNSKQPTPLPASLAAPNKKIIIMTATPHNYLVCLPS